MKHLLGDAKGIIFTWPAINHKPCSCSKGRKIGTMICNLLPIFNLFLSENMTFFAFLPLVVNKNVYWLQRKHDTVSLCCKLKFHLHKLLIKNLPSQSSDYGKLNLLLFLYQAVNVFTFALNVAFLTWKSMVTCSFLESVFSRWLG